MYRRMGDEWSGDPLLAAAIHLSVRQMLEALPSDEELAERRKSFAPPKKELSGYIKRYAQHVTSGSTGAVFE